LPGRLASREHLLRFFDQCQTLASEETAIAKFSELQRWKMPWNQENWRESLWIFGRYQTKFQILCSCGAFATQKNRFCARKEERIPEPKKMIRTRACGASRACTSGFKSSHEMSRFKNSFSKMSSKKNAKSHVYGAPLFQFEDLP
jgi:hypothetical protein